MEEEYGIKAYVQKTIGVLDMLNIIGFSLGVNKIYYGEKAESFNPEKTITQENYTSLKDVTRSDNCSIDVYEDSKGVFYAAMTDPSFLFHGFKIEDEPFNRILNGESASISFMERDSLSLALAVTIVNKLGGVVTLDGNKVHHCLDKNCEYPLVSKKEMKEAMGDCPVEVFNRRFYEKEDMLRKSVVLSTEFITQLHDANPELDRKYAMSRIKKYVEHYEGENPLKNQSKIKIGR